MDKIKAAGIISQAASIFENQHRSKNLLIIFGEPNHPQYIETKADSKNFLHLTGVVLNKTSILSDIPDHQGNVSEIFFEKTLYRKLSPNDFDFKKDGTTEQKLNVLTQALRIASNAKMIGEYSGNRLKLQTDKLAGSVYSCVGFINIGQYYVPNTVLATDIRQEVHERRRVLAVLSKSIVEEKYSVIESVAKKMDIQLLLSRIEKQVPIAAKLLSPLQEQAITSQNTQIKFPKAEPIVLDAKEQSAIEAARAASRTSYQEKESS